MTQRAGLPEMVAWAEGIIASRPRDFAIGPEGDPQLRRWYLVPRSEGLNVYLHEFRRSDDDRALHDHPGDNVSWVLSGSYLEVTPEGTFTRRPGDIVRRTAEAAHRIELPPGTGRVLSLFQIGPIRREWGFHCPQGWRRWQDFVAVYEGGNAIGRGCA